MTYIDSLDDLARSFLRIIGSTPGVTPVPTKDYGWENHRYSSPTFRMAHVEVFNRDRFMVLHCCVFPHVDDPSPIFGFDAIAGDSKVTGLFMDLSPTGLGPQRPFTDIAVASQRVRPPWGRIFGDNWIACRPERDEFDMICGESTRVLSRYLGTLGRDRVDGHVIADMQDRYCLQQRRNEHTLRAIRNLLGEELAREFVTEVLFPTTRATAFGGGRDPRYPAMMTTHDVAVLSRLAAGIPRGGRAVECGSALGGSAMVILDANPGLGELHLIDSEWANEGDPLAHELELYHESVMDMHDQFDLAAWVSPYDFARDYLSGHGNVVMHRRPTPYGMGDWQGEVDFVYEDSSHRNPQLADNLGFWWQHLRSGGIMAGHDYGWGCKDVDATVNTFARDRGLDVRSDANLWWVSKP